MSKEYKVTFYDIEENEDDIIEWALDNCNSFDCQIKTDISDVSMSYDIVHDFYFSSESDAVWFKLRWS